MDDLTVDPVDDATHRRLAVDLFNRSWRLLELPDRTKAQEYDLIHVVHASCHHWRVIGSAANSSRAENQCARVYAALGRPEPALTHANRCLELVRAERNAHEAWDLASALEVLARAHLAAGDRVEAGRHATLAQTALEAVADPDDREIVAAQLAELELNRG